MSNIKFEVDDSVLAFTFGTTAKTAVIAGKKGDAEIILLEPYDVVLVRDWLSGRIDWLKDNGHLPDTVTGTTL